LIPPKVVLDAVGNVYAEGIFNADLKLANDTLLKELSVVFLTNTEPIDISSSVSEVVMVLAYIVPLPSLCTTVLATASTYLAM
jgi:hypothetical protein